MKKLIELIFLIGWYDSVYIFRRIWLYINNLVDLDVRRVQEVDLGCSTDEYMIPHNITVTS